MTDATIEASRNLKVAPGPETRVLPGNRDLRVHSIKKCGLTTLTGNAC